MDTFSFYKSSDQHLRIDDLVTGQTFTASCHFKGKGLYNPSEITTLFRMIKNSTEARQENIGREEVSSSNNYIKLARWVKIEEEDDTREANLKDWFKEKFAVWNRSRSDSGRRGSLLRKNPCWSSEQD